MKRFKQIFQSLLVIVTVITAAYTVSLYAQTASQDQAQSQQPVTGEDQEQEQSQAAPSGDDSAAQAPEQSLPDIDSQPIQPGARSTGRFIPSEQISQDLGVSFPVDI
ncbi:MAG: hypothetical protein Q8S94_15140 [Pseudohongiella sp.]|nr:hypothetical protein [Pseudohongiella sp.]